MARGITIADGRTRNARATTPRAGARWVVTAGGAADLRRRQEAQPPVVEDQRRNPRRHRPPGSRVPGPTRTRPSGRSPTAKTGVGAACRLAREGCTPDEFIAEVVLNLAESLEVLFPPAGDSQTREGARPAFEPLVSRSRTSSATSSRRWPCVTRSTSAVSSSGYSRRISRESSTVSRNGREGAFRELFERMLTRVESGEAAVPHELGPARQSAVTVIERLRKCIDERAG
jgi:hypothetical protein